MAKGFGGRGMPGMGGMNMNMLKQAQKMQQDMMRMQQEQQDKIASQRRMQVGTGDRSERIRTYNFPQGRLTDHRIGLTIYRLEDVMNGNLDEVLDALATADQAAKLAMQQAEGEA